MTEPTTTDQHPVVQRMINRRTVSPAHGNPPFDPALAAEAHQSLLDGLQSGELENTDTIREGLTFFAERMER